MAWLLANAPGVRSLRVRLQPPPQGDAVRLEPLASISNLTSLHTLHLNLDGIGMGDQGLLALCGLGRLFRLRNVSLDLATNAITNFGLLFLVAELEKMSQLTAIHLGLRGNKGISLFGATGLAELRHLPRLTKLSLDLSATAIGTLGIQTLAALRETPRLTSLSLVLQECDAEFQSLATLRLALHLRELHLGLGHNSVALASMQALLELSTSPSLRWLSLDLAQTHLTPDIIPSLADFRKSNLNSLSLGLDQNSLEDDAARSLVALKDARHLRSLELGLSNNSIGLSGVCALTRLCESNTLRSLCVDLRMNPVASSNVSLAVLHGPPVKCDFQFTAKRPTSH